MGDEGRVGNALELCAERRGEREDVGHHDARAQLAHEWKGVLGGVHHCLVEVERLGARGKHGVLGRRREGHALRLHV